MNSVTQLTIKAVLRMLESIGTVENVPKFLEDVKSKKKKLMGFGHRIYKNYDPRAKIIRKIAYEVTRCLSSFQFFSTRCSKLWEKSLCSKLL